MLFNSLQFILFFFCVFFLYWALGHRQQNRFLLVASYIFYGAWDWRFLSLLWLSTAVDYYCALKIHEFSGTIKRKRYLVASIAIQLTILGIFKYFNFFVGNFAALMSWFGVSVPLPVLHVILPVGVSFYTFQTMSYTIDVYRGKLAPARNFWDFALYVSFFPQLVAGPIERATHLLPQVLSPRVWNREQFYEGAYLMLWGYFEKVFVADNLARLVDPVFSAGGPYTGAAVLGAVYGFAFQIYCDFDGYSNIARGVGKMMGFDLMVNFNLPYFAANPREFWQRWHISLSTWLKDYLYIPLGGNRNGDLQTCRNLFITMFLGGLWHGATWMFVLWGAYHGVLLAAHRFSQPLWRFMPHFENKAVKILTQAMKMAVVFHLVCLGWLMFRTGSLEQFWEMLRVLSWRGAGPFAAMWFKAVVPLLWYIWILLVVQAVQFYKKDLMAMYRFHGVTKAVFYYVICILIIIWGVTGGQQFIYFQF